MDRRSFSKTVILGVGASVAPFSVVVMPNAVCSMATGSDRNIDRVRVALVPTSVDDWDKEDQFTAVLGSGVEKADEAQAREMLEQTRLELPKALDWKELVRYAQQHKTPSGLNIPPDNKRFSYYLLEMPLTVMSTSNNRLVRLRLVLNLETKPPNVGDTVAYDVFPPPEIDVRKRLGGEVNLDVSKALKFVLTGPATPLADSLGLKLNWPFQWDSTSVKLQSSGRMSNPVEWYVSDDSILKSFAPCAILRAPKGGTVTVRASLAGEVRRGWKKAQFRSFEPRSYVLR